MTSSGARGLAASFGPLEYEILEALWRIGESSVAECVDALPGRQAYSTVKTVMERMVDKGHLARVKSGRAFRYSTTATREEMTRRAATRSSRDLLAGFGSVAVSSFVDQIDPASPEFDELVARLQAVVDRSGGADRS
ncbi:BlaI/MecI/CopY family transcriptional regulator [Clavibacter tessellarius]|uniref:BlaI/MecI/CopY family transcriptional regulator n=1 Tax=Clavibacter tessellarius TaxID=31965 RepID=UPI0039EA8DE9